MGIQDIKIFIELYRKPSETVIDMKTCVDMPGSPVYVFMKDEVSGFSKDMRLEESKHIKDQGQHMLKRFRKAVGMNAYSKYLNKDI